MITDKDKLIKVSFYFKPNEKLGIVTKDDVRETIYQTFDPFNLYSLDIEQTTMEEEYKQN